MDGIQQQEGVVHFNLRMSFVCQTIQGILKISVEWQCWRREWWRGWTKHVNVWPVWKCQAISSQKFLWKTYVDGSVGVHEGFWLNKYATVVKFANWKVSWKAYFDGYSRSVHGWSRTQQLCDRQKMRTEKNLRQQIWQLWDFYGVLHQNGLIFWC